ncbi:MAG: recombination-associated protein RdgC [Thermodesulfobacteriota bacterium]|nr:recombination-associated protein RdgC [Thermodesulfobacteriota bacterium]
MGLSKGTLTFTRYRVAGRLPDQFPDFIDRQIKLFAFREMSSAGEEESLGWTSLDNILDNDFEYANYSIANYIVSSLRIDRRTVPPALLKLRVLKAEKEFLEEKGLKKLYKGQREDIRETVKSGLLNRAHPVPSFYEICWSVSGEWLIFGSLSEKVNDEFKELFKRSFDLPLTHFLPWDSESIPADILLPGREFLTWLWFKSEERGGSVMIPDRGDMKVIFLQKIVLESGEGEYSETVACKGFHADLEEGKSALRKGKKVTEARIKLGAGNDDFEFTFKADTFSFQALRLPVPTDDEEEDRDGRILERIYLVEVAMKTMEQLFALFLEKRFSPRWTSEELPHMKKWLVG